MKVIPAVDLRDGCCVQLVNGSFDRETLRFSDPVKIAKYWIASGYEELHVVDLNAAIGDGSNTEIVKEIVSEFPGRVRVGGGVRDTRSVRNWISAGVSKVVVGTRAILDAEWLTQLSDDFPSRIVVAADVVNNKIVTNGWKNETGFTVTDFIGARSPLPLAAWLVTTTQREGLMLGTDLELFSDVAEVSRIPVIASGGVTNEQLPALESIVDEVIIGMSLYQENLQNFKELKS